MRYDVAVVGGAVTGLCVALALAKRGLRVAVVEAREAGAAPDPTRVFDSRVSALTPVSWQVLRNLGVVARLPSTRVAEIDEMRVWDRAGFGELTFDAADAGLAHLGKVVENRELEWALALAAGEDARIRWYRPARVQALDVAAELVTVHTDVAKLEARLVVAADGTRSRVRELVGIAARTRSYQQHAVVTTVRVAEAPPRTAWQRFMSTGPLALLPLPDGFASMIWSTTHGQAEALCALSDEAFAETLTHALEQRVGALRVAAPRQRFPLLRLSAERYLGPRVALIGDAAHTIHPLAGQGVNLGLLDAATLADVVGELWTSGRDIGRVAGLRPYERARRAHNAMVGDAMSAFHRVFTSDAAPVAMLRNLGFAATQRLTPAKRLFIHYASGFAGPLPSLAEHARDY